LEGILQILSDNYKSVDKFWVIKKKIFGTPVDNIFQAVISYIAHMVSDFCNIRSLPYPGSTFLMEWGSDNVRKALSVAFRSKLYNSRVFIYQNLELLVMNIIIYGRAIYDNYVNERKINLFAGNMYKYQTMLLASYAVPCVTNITIFLQPWLRFQREAMLRKALIRVAKTSPTAGTLCAICAHSAILLFYNNYFTIKALVKTSCQLLCFNE
jgi:hypothetical protein